MATTNPTTTYFNYSQIMVLIFEGESYDCWSLQMKTLFISQDLWELVGDRFESPEDAAALGTWHTYMENKKKDANALLYIQQGVDAKTIF